MSSSGWRPLPSTRPRRGSRSSRSRCRGTTPVSCARLDLWYGALWELHGLWLDPEARLVHHRGREVTLTKREFQRLGFRLDRPHRCFTADRITGQAWDDSGLSHEEGRNYVLRVGKVLAQLGVRCDLVYRPRQGYPLIFRSAELA